MFVPVDWKPLVYGVTWINEVYVHVWLDPTSRDPGGEYYVPLFAYGTAQVAGYTRYVYVSFKIFWSREEMIFFIKGHNRKIVRMHATIENEFGEVIDWKEAVKVMEEGIYLNREFLVERKGRYAKSWNSFKYLKTKNTIKNFDILDKRTIASIIDSP